MTRIWRRVLLVLVCCVFAAVAWLGALSLAGTISAVRSYQSSPAEIRAAADAAVLPAADPPFTGSDEYTEEEQAEAAERYYASIGGDPLDVEPLEPIIGDFVSFIPYTPTGDETQISSASQTFIVNTSSGVFHLPGCRHIDQMNSANRTTFNGTRSEAAALYTPCKDCNP